MKYKWHIASGLAITCLLVAGIIYSQPAPKSPAVKFQQTADTSQPAITDSSNTPSTDTTTQTTAPTATPVTNSTQASTQTSTVTPSPTPSPTPTPAQYVCPAGMIAISADGTVCQPDCTYVSSQITAAAKLYWSDPSDVSAYTTAATNVNNLNTQYACSKRPLPIPPFAPGVLPPVVQ
jgi:hypothetical protein